jgi:predicted RNA-binding Zn-ribbon protein involved in translation (DUF1610 family)
MAHSISPVGAAQGAPPSASADAPRALPRRPIREKGRITPSGRRATVALKMACPHCGGTESAIVRSHGSIVIDQVRRRRECADCGARFPTSEAVDFEALERDRERELERLRLSASTPDCSNPDEAPRP